MEVKLRDYLALPVPKIIVDQVVAQILEWFPDCTIHESENIEKGIHFPLPNI